MHSLCVCDRRVREDGLSFFPSFNYQMLRCKVTDTGISFISGSTSGGINCVQYYDNCRIEYQYGYSETSGTKIKALHELKNCHIKSSSYCKFVVISVLHYIL
jgi:hypothetical protein